MRHRDFDFRNCNRKGELDPDGETEIRKRYIIRWRLRSSRRSLRFRGLGFCKELSWLHLTASF